MGTAQEAVELSVTQQDLHPLQGSSHLPSTLGRRTCSARKACTSDLKQVVRQVPAPQFHNSCLCPAPAGGGCLRGCGASCRTGHPCTAATSAHAPALQRTPINQLLAHTGPRLAPTASLPALRAPNLPSCRGGSEADGGTFFCWVPALVEAFSLELQAAASWPEWPRSCRGSVGKSGRKAAPCGEWQERRSASRWLCLGGGSAAPGARPPLRRVPGFPSRGHGSR